MKESMNLKESKQSKYLVGLYISELAKDNNLAACFHSIANQTLPVDLVIFTQGLSSEEVSAVKALADKPFVSIVERDEQGQAVEKIIESTKGVNYQLIETNSIMGFAKIFNDVFNMAFENGYEGISLVEPEDGYSVKWFEIANKYSEENPSIGVFAPLIRNMNGNTFSGVMNESCWVEGMAEEAGKFDLNLLQRFNCLNPLGAVYKIKQIIEHTECEKDAENNPIAGTCKPMKESMKLSHYYEFFLRIIYDAVPVMTIPRIGYELKTIRKQAFQDSTCKIPQDLTMFPADRGGVTQDEARFWFEIAKKEFFHDEDRKKIYEQSA